MTSQRRKCHMGIWLYKRKRNGQTLLVCAVFLLWRFRVYTKGLDFSGGHWTNLPGHVFSTPFSIRMYGFEKSLVVRLSAFCSKTVFLRNLTTVFIKHQAWLKSSSIKYSRNFRASSSRSNPNPKSLSKPRFIKIRLKFGRPPAAR